MGGAGARMELDRIRAGLGEGGLRFKSSVQELRFDPSYRSSASAASAASAASGVQAMAGWSSLWETTGEHRHGSPWVIHLPEEKAAVEPPGNVDKRCHLKW